MAMRMMVLCYFYIIIEHLRQSDTGQHGPWQTLISIMQAVIQAISREAHITYTACHLPQCH
jgi:hypothetical protein